MRLLSRLEAKQKSIAICGIFFSGNRLRSLTNDALADSGALLRYKQGDRLSISWVFMLARVTQRFVKGPGLLDGGFD